MLYIYCTFIAHLLCKKSNKLGFMVGDRGLVRISMVRVKVSVRVGVSCRAVCGR